MSDQQLISEGRRLGILGGQPGSAAAPGGADFAAQFRPFAEKASERIFATTGQRIDPNAILAQAALETGWGKSAPGNNFFGIKGQGQTMPTKEFMDGRMQSITDSFRAYENPEQSFLDYADLVSGGRYLPGLAGTAKDPSTHGANMAALGYATDPQYGEKYRSVYQRIAGGAAPDAGSEPPGMLARAADAALNFLVPSASAEETGGNIDLHARPIVRNPDGSISTVRSKSFNFDGKEVLIPTVSDDGRVMSDEEAIQTYRRTGRHLGIFNTPEEATAYAQRLHDQQAAEYLPRATVTPPPSASTDLQRLQDSAAPGTVGTEGGVKPVPTEMTDAQLLEIARRLGIGTPGTTPTTAVGAPFHDRLRASFKTPAGLLNFIQEEYGKGNVAVRPDGRVFYRDAPDGQWKSWDESGFSLGDIGDIAGDVPAAGGSMIGAGLTGGQPWGAGLGAAIGDVIKQVAGHFVPGDDELTWGQRGVEVGGNAFAGAASQWLANKAVALFDKLRPSNLAANQVRRSLETPYAKEGAQLTKDTGVKLSLGQQTGNRLQLGMEGLARRNFVTADQFREFGDEQLTAAVSKLDDVMNATHGRPVGRVGYGLSVSKAFDDAVSKVTDLRRAQAAKDFALIDDAAGKQPLIRTDNFRRVLQEIVRDHAGPGMPAMSQKVAGEAQAILDGVSLVKEGVKASPTKYRATAQRVQKWLERWGNAAAGTGRAFSDLDTAADRRIAGQIKDAILQDIDDTAREAGLRGEMAQALQTARGNYAKASEALDTLRSSVIGRYLDAPYEKAPEKVADMVMRMAPTEMDQTLRLLNRHDPEIIAKTRRYVIEKAMEDAVPAPSQQMAGSIEFSPAKFVGNLPKGQAFDTLFGSSMSRNDLVQVRNVLQRIIDRGGTEGSPTAPLLMAWDLAKGVFTLNPRAIAGIPTAILAPKAVARAALTPQGRQALVTLTKTGVPQQQILQAAEMLIALSATEGDATPEMAKAAGGQALP